LTNAAHLLISFTQMRSGSSSHGVFNNNNNIHSVSSWNRLMNDANRSAMDPLFGITGSLIMMTISIYYVVMVCYCYCTFVVFNTVH